jgi:hypothetical protein
MPFDHDKFKRLVQYIAWKAGRRDWFGATKLNKVLWFADARLFVLRGRPIAGATYLREKFGPVPKQMMPVRAELEQEFAGTEIRSLRRLKRESPESPFVFVSELGSPFTTAGFRKMVARLGVAAKFKSPVHPHMLRHACGFKLANNGVDTRALQHYLGH